MTDATHAELPTICPLCALELAAFAKQVKDKDIHHYDSHTLTFVIARARFGLIAGWEMYAPMLPADAEQFKRMMLAEGRAAGKGAGDVLPFVQRH